jgi:hypothetical protein
VPLEIRELIREIGVKADHALTFNPYQMGAGHASERASVAGTSGTQRRPTLLPRDSRVGRTPCAPFTRTSESTGSGTTFVTPSRATLACASITFSSVRRWPPGSRTRRSKTSDHAPVWIELRDKRSARRGARAKRKTSSPSP